MDAKLTKQRTLPREWVHQDNSFNTTFCKWVLSQLSLTVDKILPRIFLIRWTGNLTWNSHIGHHWNHHDESIPDGVAMRAESANLCWLSFVCIIDRRVVLSKSDRADSTINLRWSCTQTVIYFFVKKWKIALFWWRTAGPKLLFFFTLNCHCWTPRRSSTLFSSSYNIGIDDKD